jgi:hypothetical protein
MRKVCSIVIGALLLAGCGESTSSGNDEEPAPRDEVAERTVPAAGPAMLPPLDSELLDGLVLERFMAPDDIDPELVAQVEQSPNGEIALYGDPAAEDPFDAPWALAVVFQGSETSGLGGDFDPKGTDVRWFDVPVEQQNQELRSAGLLVGGMDEQRGRRLAEGVEVAGHDVPTEADEGPNTIDIDVAAIDGAPADLQRLTSSPVSGWEIGAASPGSTTMPSVTWSRRSDRGWASLSVTSFRADTAWQLLLRAVNGGDVIGANLLPVGGESAVDQSTGVATIEGATVLVQTQGGAPPIAEVIGSLEPAGAASWETLAREFPMQPPPTALPSAEVVLTGDALGGAYTYAVDVDTFDTPFGPSTVCRDQLMVAYPDGEFDGGGGLTTGQPCGPTGTIGLLALDNEATLIHGELNPEIVSIRLTLDGDEVLEPELEGDPRRAFVVVLDGSRRLQQVEALAADGRLVASFPDGQTELGFPEGTRASAGTVLQGR